MDREETISAEQDLRNEQILERLLSASTSMTGICVALLGAVNGFSRSQNINTVVDDILALNALGFLICCYLIVWALRTSSRRRTATLLGAVEYSFLAAMTLMVMVGFFIVYSIL